MDDGSLKMSKGRLFLHVLGALLCLVIAYGTLLGLSFLNTYRSVFVVYFGARDSMVFAFIALTALAILIFVLAMFIMAVDTVLFININPKVLRVIGWLGIIGWIIIYTVTIVLRDLQGYELLFMPQASMGVLFLSFLGVLRAWQIRQRGEDYEFEEIVTEPLEVKIHQPSGSGTDS